VNDHLLVAENLRCTVGQRDLFAHLSLAVGAGELVEVRGANGSGKSTLLRCLVGLAEPDAGDVHRGGSVRYHGHLPGVSGRMTATENLRWLAGIDGEEVAGDSIEAALVRVGLGDARHTLCDALSAGQVRRAALARLLVGAADLWILDEPLTSLDESGVELVRGLVAEQLARGGAAVCATHRTVAAADKAPVARVVDLSP